MTRVVTMAGRVVGQGHMASVSMHRPGQGLFTPWASGDDARDLDKIQYVLDDGPCVAAFRSGSVAHVVLTDADAPWREFASRSRPFGVGSVLSTPMVVEDAVIGALNVYAREARPFGDHAVSAASELADLAAAVVGTQKTLQDRLQDAMETRGVIARAQGVLMVWQRCSAEEAFSILRRTSVRDDRPLVEVAHRVLAAAGEQGR